MIGLALRGFFLIGIISWYSFGVLKIINDYFRGEYINYLTSEYKKNKYLMPDVNLQLKKDKAAQESTCTRPQSFNLPSFLAQQPLMSQCPKDIKSPISSDNADDNDESIVNYWLNRNSPDNDGKNEAYYCRVDENAEKCKDN